MSLEDFQLFDNESFDNRIIKRDYTKIYHNQGANLNVSNQNVEFIFGENNNYDQIGNSYLEFDITVRKVVDIPNNPILIDTDQIRLINNAFGYCFTQATLSTTEGMDLEDIKYVGQVSTIVRLITSKDVDLSSYFDKNLESVVNNDNPLKRILINNHSVDANKGKSKGHLPLEHIFGFCRTFKKTTKNLGFHLIFKMNDLQDIVFTTIANDINVTLTNLYLFVPILVPNSQTQLMFNESLMNNYTITFDSWYTERKISNDGRELQVDIGSAQHINSPKYLIAVFQTTARTTRTKAAKPAIFDINHVTKYFVEIDGIRYPKDGVLTNFEENSYLDQ